MNQNSFNLYTFYYASPAVDSNMHYWKDAAGAENIALDLKLAFTGADESSLCWKVSSII